MTANLQILRIIRYVIMQWKVHPQGHWTCVTSEQLQRCCSISNKLAAAMSAPKVVSPSAKPDNIGSRRNRADGKKK